MTDDKYAVEVINVKKSFFLPHYKNNSLKTAITQILKPKQAGGSTFNALNDISFKVEKGDFFGVLGRNGSGKSTLLKIISEIYQPTAGSVKHDGKLVSFIELGVGFRAELTGRENVFLNGALLGFSKDEVASLYEEIVEFAELEQFMDQKLKNYSSGMKVRLAFSVAIRAKADILILDEVLAVGDAAFQKKCTDYFETLKDDGKTVILVTHNMNNVRKFCNKAVVIEDGVLHFNGRADDAADRYLELFVNNRFEADNGRSNKYIEKAVVRAKCNQKTVSIDLSVKAARKLDDAMMAILINRNGEQMFRWASDEKTNKSIVLRKNAAFKINLKLQNIFPTGRYTVDVWVRKLDRSVDYGRYNNVVSFEVKNTTTHIHDVLWHPNEEFEIEQ